MAKIKINRGTTFVIGVQYQKDGENTSIDGATIFFTVKKPEYDAVLNDSTALIAKNITSHYAPAEGYSEISLDPADTIPLDPKVAYHYDVKIKEAGGAIYKLDEGTIALDGSPTNRTTA